ncbi:adenosylcobinamide-phosphate synthase CbiB [Sporosalibacterium faouarense]|uniref:adenosylcobinamide-phosphate synthase CbiB n=1 Tax=Sporosalibacterium faouarense TaxID=516123 RepID=UPI00141CD6CA|nr:adenosylcobinamide-phosphate synthase CbiB [Sporosalibacterium faouarense]MTI46589.1 cobalamin biosynthesis protein CobD [Bacillota bacterium]
MKYILILVIAVLLDFFLGDPQRWPHPIRYIGWMIKKYEGMIRKQKIVDLKVGGFLLIFLSLVTVFIVIALILFVTNFIHPIIKDIVLVYLTYTALAAKCLAVETKKVYKALEKENVHLGRKMLSYLVGRDTTQLTKEETVRGAVETVAENTVDGVLAPIFYFVIGIFLGMPLQMIFIYKTINTLDSMVGYIHEKYRDIGFASAKIDDIANFVPARIGSLCMLLGGLVLGFDIKTGFKILIRDRKNHKSPNCGYPEAAVAGLLRIQLGGTNTYFGETIYKPTIGDPIEDLKPQKILETIRVMYASEIIMVLVAAMVFLV